MELIYFVLGFIMGAIFMYLIDHAETGDDGDWRFRI